MLVGVVVKRGRVAAGESKVSKALTFASVEVRRAASSFFFLHREMPHKPMQIRKTKMMAVSIFGKNFLILNHFYSDFIFKFEPKLNAFFEMREKNLFLNLYYCVFKWKT